MMGVCEMLALIPHRKSNLWKHTRGFWLGRSWNITIKYQYTVRRVKIIASVLLIMFKRRSKQIGNKHESFKSGRADLDFFFVLFSLENNSVLANIKCNDSLFVDFVDRLVRLQSIYQALHQVRGIPEKNVESFVSI